MLFVKRRYIAGLFLTLAVFGLASCTKKSKSAKPVIKNEQPPLPADDTDSSIIEPSASFYIDPTQVYSHRISVEESDAGIPMGRRPVFTGLQSEADDSLFFTDNNIDTRDHKDTLIEQLRLQMRERFVDAELAEHKDFAQALKIQQVILDPVQPDEVRVLFTFKASGRSAAPYVMVGTIGDVEGKRGSVRKRMAILKVGKGADNIKITLQCMDRTETCHHAILHFVEKNTNRQTFAVFRTTAADLTFISGNSNGNDNNEFEVVGSLVPPAEEFTQILRKSTRPSGPRQKPRIKSLIVESTAILFGKSQFAVVARIDRKDKETVLSFFGPLVRSRSSNSVDLNLGNYKKHTLLKNASDYDPLMKQITDVVLLENDGRGTLQLELTFGADQQSEPVVLTIARKFVELRALRD